MYVGERAKELVDVEFDFEGRHSHLHLIKVARCSVYGLGDIFQYEIEVNFVFLSTSSVILHPAHIDEDDLYARTRSPLE